MNGTVNGVVDYVISQHITTESYREGLKSGTRASFHMDVPEYAVVLKYICEYEGCTMEQAQFRFLTKRDAALNSKAKSPSNIGAVGGFFISLILAIVPGAFLGMLGDTYLWLKVVAAALVPMIFMALLFWLVWNPRKRVMDSIWSNANPLEKQLEELHTVQQMSLTEIISTYQKPQGIALGLIALVLIIGLPYLASGDVKKDQAFHNALADVVVSQDNDGTRYAVYDVKKGRYVDLYLSDEQQALTAADVRAVLRISEGEKIVGMYSGQGNAYQRYVTIELVDQRDGKTVLDEKVYGGDPPRSITVKAGSRNKDGYGSRPSEEEITKACSRLIKQFENMQ